MGIDDYDDGIEKELAYEAGYSNGFSDATINEQNRTQILIDLLETIKPRFYSQIKAALDKYNGQ